MSMSNALSDVALARVGHGIPFFIFAVCSLNALQKFAMFMLRCPNMGPSGGAELAIPAGISERKRLLCSTFSDNLRNARKRLEIFTGILSPVYFLFAHKEQIERSKTPFFSCVQYITEKELWK